MSRPDLAAVLALPDDALVPVRLVRELAAGLEARAEDDGLGLTVQEVADKIGRAPSTVRTWAAEGRLPGAKRLRGREWRIPPSSLRALLEDEDPAPRRSAQRLQTPPGGLAAWRNS